MHWSKTCAVLLQRWQAWIKMRVSLLRTEQKSLRHYAHFWHHLCTTVGIGKHCSMVRAFLYTAPTLGNALPDTIRDSDSINSFRKNLTTLLFNSAWCPWPNSPSTNADCSFIYFVLWYQVSLLSIFRLCLTVWSIVIMPSEVEDFMRYNFIPSWFWENTYNRYTCCVGTCLTEMSPSSRNETMGWRVGSVGRASDWRSKGRGFESGQEHNFF